MTRSHIPKTSDITQLLERLRAGDSSARDLLFTAAYEDLQRLARARMHESGRSINLQTTVLVHECYLRLVFAPDLRAEDRRAFFAYASQVMRSVIVGDARARMTERRGGGARMLPLETGLDIGPAADEAFVVRVHEALLDLEQADERLGQVVQLRFFGGFDDGEIARTLGIAERTVRRDWEKAKVMLSVALR